MRAKNLEIRVLLTAEAFLYYALFEKLSSNSAVDELETLEGSTSSPSPEPIPAMSCHWAHVRLRRRRRRRLATSCLLIAKTFPAQFPRKKRTRQLVKVVQAASDSIQRRLVFTLVTHRCTSLSCPLCASHSTSAGLNTCSEQAEGHETS